MSKIDPLSPWPVYEDDERAVVDGILRSGKVNYWTGDECREFENEFAEYHDSRYGVALANGTLALELALRALGVGPGDEVIVTPRSFFASASCVVQVGAVPVFADVDLDSQNITADSISEVISEKTRAVVAVHLAGWPCEMPSIMKLAREKGLVVIEDCAQAHGAEINGKKVGQFGDAAAFSFCQDKIMSTAGEGGMLLVQDKSTWESAWSYKDHGKDWNAVYVDDHPRGFRWLHNSFGSNWRMTEIQGAVGRLQLRKLEEWVAQREKNAGRLVEALRELELVRVPRPGRDVRHANYKFYCFIEPTKLKSGWDRERVLAELERNGCPGWSGSCPEIYREKAFEKSSQPVLAAARELGETSIMLPVHPTLTERNVDDICDVARDVFRAATK